MIDITEILVHWYAGRSQHDVAGSLGVARGAIRRYVEPAITSASATATSSSRSVIRFAR